MRKKRKKSQIEFVIVMCVCVCVWTSHRILVFFLQDLIELYLKLNCWDTNCHCVCVCVCFINLEPGTNFFFCSFIILMTWSVLRWDDTFVRSFWLLGTKQKSEKKKNGTDIKSLWQCCVLISFVWWWLLCFLIFFLLFIVWSWNEWTIFS